MEFVIIAKKKWNEATLDTYPCRVVLTAKTVTDTSKTHQENANKYAVEYTTHIQIDGRKDGNKIYLANGHYFQTLDGAIQDFKERF